MDTAKELAKLEKQAAELAIQAKKFEHVQEKIKQLKAHKDQVIGQLVREKIGDLRPAYLLYFARVLDEVSGEFEQAFSHANGKYEPSELQIFDPKDRAEIRADLKKLRAETPDSEAPEPEEITPQSEPEPQEENTPETPDSGFTFREF